MTARQSKRPGVTPQPPGQAAGIRSRERDSAATPGTPEVPPVTGDGVPGDASSPLPACRPGGGEGAQASRPGRARQPAPGTGIKAWEAALTAQNRDSRNRRGKRPGPRITGVRTPPPDGAA